MDDFLHDLSVQHGEIRDVLLERLYLVVDGHRIDDSIHPHGLDVGDVRGIDFILYVVDISFIDKFLPQNFGFKFLLLSVVDIGNFRHILVEKHLSINNLIFV